MNTMAAQPALLIACCWAALVLGGCGPGRATGEAQITLPIAGDRPPESSPAVRGGVEGIELHTFVVDDAAAILGPSLAAWDARGVPGLDPAAVSRWRAAGLRIIAVPIDDVDDWRSALRRSADAAEQRALEARGAPAEGLDDVRARDPVITPVTRQWAGLMPEWAELFAGPIIGSAGQTLALSDGVSPRRVPAGRLRVLARCWTVALPPEPGAAVVPAALQIELVAQVQPAPDDQQSWRRATGIERTPAVIDDGVVLGALRLALTASGREAIVIVPEDPAIDWAADAPERPETPEPSTSLAWPDALRAGDAMLRSRLKPGAKTVLVILPRVPAGFRLFDSAQRP